MSEQRPLKVFLSYSHEDEALKKKLENHLSALKRAKVIETWNDRKIIAGTDWKDAIDTNLVHANVILLLISSDFLASEYCYAIEMLHALERHNRGQAIVIPVMLRDVDFAGTPIAKLQMLPKDAQPVLSSAWKNEDEALKNVAVGVREAIAHFQKVREDLDALAIKESALFEDRQMEAAIAREIPLKETREIVVLLRLKHSKGLADALSETISGPYSCKASDVRSEPFQAKYIADSAGKVIESPTYRLSLKAPSLTVLDDDKKVQLEWGHDSAKFTFLVQAQTLGEQYIRVNLFRKDLDVAGVLLKANAGGEPLPGGGGGGWAETLVASVRLSLNAIAKTMYA
jgi:hypothetical protein